MRWLLAPIILAVPVTLSAQDYAPPSGRTPDMAMRKAIEERATKLDRAIAALRRHGVGDPWLAEVQIYQKAADWIVRHNEFYRPESGRWTLDTLDRRLLRAAQLSQGETPWVHQFGHAVVRAYRSRVDGSVQPYAITWPKDYGKEPQKRWRLDVVLHGRDKEISEIKFLQQHAGDRPATAAEYVQLDIFGRGNNAYRWAGETDVFEAIDAFIAVERLLGRASLLDPARVVLRGFSMGGAGTWHLGLHHPDRWCVIGPGAGFTTTHGYIKNLPKQLPDFQERPLHIYDAVDYAENAFDVPVVAYGGSEDPQLQAARNIAAKLEPLHIGIKILVGTGLAHKFPPDWQKKAEEAYAPYALHGLGRPDYPPRVHFVTYTLKYPSCFWVEVAALQRHYDYSLVDAERTDKGFTVQTKNIRALRLALPGSGSAARVVTIDGQEVQPVGSDESAVFLEQRDGKWHSVLPQRLATDRLRHLHKSAGLQGPIDDAFMEGFLCVRGTGKPWNAAASKYADAALARFQKEWDQYMRGTMPMKDDVDVTATDMATKHLILFGDPGSNYLIQQSLTSLPLKWTPERISMGNGESFQAASHVPVLIYPSPFNPGRYIVLNSGHTFHEADFRGTNALLYPRLGDYAALTFKPGNDPLATNVATAGLFDDDWQVPKR